MARYYSKHEMKKMDAKLTDENMMDASKYKEDLKSAIDKENHRINVDSAKKKAVCQRMDYDGFHQMVLGADIKGIKPNEITEIKGTKVIVNNSAVSKMSETVDPNGKFYVASDKDGNLLDDNLSVFDELRLKEENEVTMKNFTKKWKSKQDRKLEVLLQYKDNENILQILNLDILESDLFLSIFTETGNYLLESKAVNFEEQKFLLNCLIAICDNKIFNSLKKFLGKKYKMIFTDIGIKKDEIFEQEARQLFDIIAHKIL